MGFLSFSQTGSALFSEFHIRKLLIGYCTVRVIQVTQGIARYAKATHTANWSLELVGLTAAAEALVEKRPLLSTIF